MNTTLFSIKCITNLHVGSGQENFGVIDNLIQRDAITDLPCIHSSSLKGALREHCEKLNLGNVISLFGSDPDANEGKTTQGSLIFTDAQLISIPAMCDDKAVPYKLYSCKEVEARLKSMVSDLVPGNVEIDIPTVKGPTEDIDYKDFSKKADNNHLPVIARNYLKDGLSANLWYEQVLPRKSRLYFFVLHNGMLDKEFKDAITKSLVQIGANASIGYGLCKIQEVSIKPIEETK